MPNGINTLSPTFRDILLNRNVITDTITDNGLLSELVGIGYPADPSTQPLSVQSSPNIEDDGVFYKDGNISVNKYQGDNIDYQQYNVNFLPGNTNSTIAGNVWNNEPYSNIAAQLLEANEDNLESNVINNQYLDVTKLTPVDIVYKKFGNQTGSYLDENNNLNVGGPSTQPLDIIGSVTQGGGIGFDPNGGGLTSDFDVRSSLAGRVLTATGVINDTRLGQLAAGYLATAIGNNIAFELQENTLGRVNLNPISLAKGNSLIVPNYKITVGQGTLGTAGDLLERMSGAKIPFSLLGNESSIFAADSGNETGNITRANSMISNTGKGQVLQMFANMNANIDPKFTGKGARQGFVPEFIDERTGRGYNQGPLSGGSIYAYGSKLNNGGNLENIADISEGFPSLIDNVTESEDNISGDNDGLGKFIWGDENNNKPTNGVYSLKTENKNSILTKTQKLFKNNKIKTLVSGRFGKETKTEIQSGVRAEGERGANKISKGSGVLSADALAGNTSEDDNVFCRTWSPVRKYNNVQDLQKHSGLIGGPNFPNRPNANNLKSSVLNSTGFVNIGPTTDEEGNLDDIKRYMFSIENLAWADDLTNLLECEKGPGDPLSGLRGRIMWFPPYDISFNETTSVSWDKSNFIGRGEPIYTYNNTERTGTLSWKVIIDHPNYANFFPDNFDNDDIASFFAGCLEYEDVRNLVLTQQQRDDIEKKDNTKKPEKVDDTLPPDVTFTVYFPNDESSIPITYEDGLDSGGNKLPVSAMTEQNGTTTGDGTVGGGSFVYPNNTNFGLNGWKQPITIDGVTTEGWIKDNDFFAELNTFMIEKCKYCRVNITGYASTQGNQSASNNDNSSNNQTLSEERAKNVENWFKNQVMTQVTITPNGSSIFDDKLVNKRYKTSGSGSVSVGDGCSGDNGQDRLGCKKARKVEVTISYDASLKEDELIDSQYENPNTNPFSDVSIPASRFFTECHYFKKIEENNNFVYDNIREKLKYFHPSFHSITPEGFNSRLNFLHQCTRQGPTKHDQGIPDNLAFGRPPVSILRIGDFYHTKIAIDSMSLDFEPLVWDLNPEGVGVQPMIANVTINFAFIGGSSLEGPINKLQNAVSYNFFANTEIYDARADRIKIKQGLQANDEGKGYGELVPGEKVNSPKTPLEEPQNKLGLSNNTNDSTNNQEVESNNEANKTENTQVNQYENDIIKPVTAKLVESGVNSLSIGVQLKKDISQDYTVKKLRVEKLIFNEDGTINDKVYFEVPVSDETITSGKDDFEILTSVKFSQYKVNNVIIDYKENESNVDYLVSFIVTSSDGNNKISVTTKVGQNRQPIIL